MLIFVAGLSINEVEEPGFGKAPIRNVRPKMMAARGGFMLKGSRNVCS